MNIEQLLTESLRASAHGKRIAHILSAALKSVDPRAAVYNHMDLQGSDLFIDASVYDLRGFDRIWVIGFGKASIPMAEATSSILGGNITGGIVITKSIPSHFSLPHSKFSILKSAHPVPDESSLAGAQSVIDLLAGTTENDLLIFLISGGGSALLTLPAKDIVLVDIQALITALLSCGATINEINTLRKHLSQVKGGLLARRAAPAQVVTLVLSDVVGDPLDVIASGPTVPDTSTFSDALGILEKYNIMGSIPAAVRDHLKKGAKGEIPETPKLGDPIFDKVKNHIVGNNYQAAHTAATLAKDNGFNTLLLTTFLQGESRSAGQLLAAIAREIDASGNPIPRPACIIAGGETTVTLSGAGLGGRNQELALAAVADLAGTKETFLITLATDGDDGPTDAAGAVVTGETFQKARILGLHPGNFLANNDSYHFFEPLGDLLKPGPTGTNVCDLSFLFLL